MLEYVALPNVTRYVCASIGFLLFAKSSRTGDVPGMHVESTRRGIARCAHDDELPLYC